MRKPENIIYGMDERLPSAILLVLAAQHVTVCRLALDARITWRGAPLVLSETRPTKEELLMDDDASARMAGYLIGRLTSRVRSRFADGVAELHLVFDH